jgi:hypothetical protein
VASLAAARPISHALLLRSEDLRIASGSVTLAATLITPRWRPSPRAALVVVHGSGRVTRDRLSSDARALGVSGAAVLIYDKRGAGESTGVYRPMAVRDSEQRIAELAYDVVAAAEYLATRSDIDPARIGLIGGSEAGWVMPLAASRTRVVSCMVVLSGPAVSSGEEALFSELTGDARTPDPAVSEAEIDRRLASFTGTHGFDPRPILAAHHVPTLWVLGGRDRSIPPRQTEEVLRRITTGGNSAIHLEVFPTADHDLRPIAYWTLVKTWLRDRDVLR